jgi:hypothetical protein
MQSTTEKTKIVGRLAHEMTSAPVLAEERAFLIKRQVDEDNRGGKTGFMSRNMGRAIRTGTAMGGDWDLNLIVRVAFFMTASSLSCFYRPISPVYLTSTSRNRNPRSPRRRRWR